ncbi:MAG: transketolase [Candidatus Gracilibacteria bacterium]
MQIPKFTEKLAPDQLRLLEIFAKSCRKSIIEMVVNANSGHPGGSLSSIDYLATLYAFIISQTGEKIVISNGHISPAVYSTLAELGYVNKEEAVKNFRKIGSVFEGHVTRHVPGVWYGTGPLGIGVSVAAGFAKGCPKEKVYALMGDGECEEGQVYEMIHFADQHKLKNLILFVDYNKVQLTSSLKEVQNIDPKKVFESGNWNVIDCNAHDYTDIWNALSKAQKSDRPTVIIGNSIMGHGSKFMEPDGIAHKSTWHGKAPKPEEIAEDLKLLTLTAEEEKILAEFRKEIKWHPEKPDFPKLLSPLKIKTGTPIIYPAGTVTDCRTAYGKALLDLAKNNSNIIALTADLKDSVMTKFVAEELPNQYIECGIAEQNMVSMAGGLSLINYVPFASTFGAFMTSRAKDQARVNDVNYTNAKMVATHCGLSVGEDGPTHQAIDDMGSFLGFFNTMVIEPADANQTDHIIRYIASHYGNFYVRMGRHKFPVILKENGEIFYDQNYKYEYGKCNLIREGKALTIAATGAMVTEALKASENLKADIEIIAVSSIKKFDDTLLNSLKKTRKLITVEDHNTYSGLGSQIARLSPKLDAFHMIGVENYQLSGKVDELYRAAGIDSTAIENACKKML